MTGFTLSVVMLVGLWAVPSALAEEKLRHGGRLRVVIVGDLAKAWSLPYDKMTWTFTLHQGVTFHDGSALTSVDIKTSWDKMVFPPESFLSMLAYPASFIYVKQYLNQDPTTLLAPPGTELDIWLVAMSHNTTSWKSHTST